MSHRTAAAALLIASLPYGLALPQVVPLVSELAPNVTPSPLSLVSALNASSVTVIGTIVQPAVESAVEDVTDAIEDATATVASALESATDAVEDVLPEAAPSILDPEANILPLILPGILPVETDLPPIDTEDAVASDLPETNSLEVIDLPAPTEEPSSDDSPSSEPYFPDFPDEATVPISTFNAVVQPLLTVIQTLLNSLPGNFAPPLSSILPYPLLPTETPEISIDPLLPTETLFDTIATATDVIEPLIDPLVDPIPTNSIAEDMPFAKRQEVTEVDTNSILAMLTPVLEAINALIAQIPVVGSAVSDAVSTVESAAPELPIDVPALPIDVPPLPISDVALPNLPLPSVAAPDVLPTHDLPVDVPAPALPKLPLTTPPALPDFTSGLPDEVLNVPVPDDVQGIDWAAFESPPFSDLPAPSLDDVAIPDDVLNVPVPDLDENGLPIDTPADAISDVATAIADVVTAISDAVTAVSAALPTSFDAVVADATAAIPVALPTSLDAFGDFPDDLPDWPFSDVPETFTPDVTGELPDLEDIPIPDDVLNVPVPDLDDAGVPLDLPVDPADGIAASPSALPTDLNWWDIPVPDDWVDADDVASILPAPVAPTDVVADALPVPEVGDISFNSAVPDPSQSGRPVGLAAPSLPTEAFGAGFPIQAFPDIPLVLPTVSDVASQLPAGGLINEGPAALTDAFTDVPTDAISGLPTSDLADVLPAAPAITGLPEALPALPVPTNILAAAPPVAIPTLRAIAPPVAAPALAAPAVVVPALPATPAVKLPFQVPGARGPLGKRQLSNFIAQPKPASKPSVAATVDAVSLLNAVLTKLSEALSLVLGAKSVPKANSALPTVNPLASSLPLPPLPVAAPALTGAAGGLVSTLPALNVAGLVPSLATNVLPTTALDLSGLVAGAVPSLPTPDLPEVLPALPGLSDVAAPDVSSILPAPATLPDVGGLVSDVPSLAVPEIPSVLPAPASLPDLSSLTGGVLPAVAAPDVAAILPAPADLSGLGAVASAATSAVAGFPAVDTVASAVTDPLAGGAPAIPDVAGVTSAITGAAPAGLLPSLGSKLKKRHASEASQLLSELAESKKSELAALIYHSSDAVKHNNVDAMADVLKSDLDNLSDDTKSALLEGFGATTIGKRSMRYAKRQDFAGVPGVLSIGPNLDDADDAQKVDLSGFHLDPNNQLSGLAAPGKLVDDNKPPSLEQPDGPVTSLADPELLDILASGGLDPNGMLSSPAGGAPVDDGVVEDPYQGIRQTLAPSFAGGAKLEGLDATLQAAEDNHFSGKAPRLSWTSTAGGSAAAQQAEAAAKQQAGAAATQQLQQGNVMQWFQRFVKPSRNKDVDAEIVR
ncbi:hypothetical protein E8E11_007773 [Didymella keratinophila]|nr:hypothetical protein E8E11_007773 [Didymella keratinophila]